MAVPKYVDVFMRRKFQQVQKIRVLSAAARSCRIVEL